MVTRPGAAESKVSGGQLFCGNCGPMLRTEADVAGSARAYRVRLSAAQGADVPVDQGRGQLHQPRSG
jgi:hypothetical protein